MVRCYSHIIWCNKRNPHFIEPHIKNVIWARFVQHVISLSNFLKLYVRPLAVAQLGGLGANRVSPPPLSIFLAPLLPPLTWLQHDHDCGQSFIKFCQWRKNAKIFLLRFAHRVSNIFSNYFLFFDIYSLKKNLYICYFSWVYTFII